MTFRKEENRNLLIDGSENEGSIAAQRLKAERI